MKICLVSMPWQLLDMPSLALGILRRRVHLTRPDDDVHEVHGALAWAEYLLARAPGELGPDEYTHIAENGLHHGLGDWIFAGTLHDDAHWRDAELCAYAARNGVDVELARRMRPYAAGFVDAVAETIAAHDPDVVGFTTTFMQNVPSLAVARRLKHTHPDIVTVMGGANCDGPMGAALHRNHDFVDHVVRGEGELAFPRLLDHIAADTPAHDVPGVCHRVDGAAVANPEARTVVAPALVPAPDFDAWQAAFEASPVRHYVEPKLVLEGARGCWWGEKHQCTFCGLNGSAITFRSKTPDRVWAEIAELVGRHRILDLIMVDNIIDMTYFQDLLPRLAATGWDLRVHYEVKSNLRPEQVELLAAAGVVHIQPGIESLNGRVLELMDKGVGGGRNVRLLRDCHEHGLTVSWNLLYGFPGETEDDYRPVVDQLPALAHLQPPGGVTRIALERFSPYFERPELGFAQRAPSDIYRHVYDLPASELADLVYLFDTPAAGIGGRIEKDLHAGITHWQDDHPHSALTLTEHPRGELVLADTRAGLPQREHVLGGADADEYRLLDRPRTAPALHRALADRGRRRDIDRVRERLDELLAAGLVFRDGPDHVALATRNLPRPRPERAARTPHDRA